jgi:hypothetical protein
MIKVFFAFLLIPSFSYSQIKAGQIFTDSTQVIGIINEDCYVGKTITNYCTTGSDKYFLKGTTVAISGAIRCSYNETSPSTDFYEFYINLDRFFIKKDRITTLDKNVFEKIKSLNGIQQEKFKENAIYISSLMAENQKKKALNFITRSKLKGILVTNWSFYDESEFTKGIGVKIQVLNPTNKTIKYIWFTFTGYNAVGDKVIDSKRGTNITMQGIGPIKPDETGSYSFEYVWFTDLVDDVKITSIKVQYMDGSIKIISNPKDVILPQQYYESILGE